MRIVLLSGGSGKRLWPLSNEVRSKIFLKLLDKTDGGKESMLQRICRQLDEVGLLSSALIVTHESQVDITVHHVGSKIPIIAEPRKKGTFHAVALTAAYLHSRLHTDPAETVCFLPADGFVETDFFQRFLRFPDILQQSGAKLALLGTRPTFPSSQFGYIVPANTWEKQPEYYPVARFVEKPEVETARALMERKALWNCGIFAFPLSFLLSFLKKKGLPTVYEDWLDRYDTLSEASFDEEVVEKTRRAIVLPYDGRWSDLGTWEALSDQLGSPVTGSGSVSDESVNTHLVNELTLPIHVVDVPGIVVAASPDGILVASKENSSRIKNLLPKERQRPMVEERRWGSYRVLDQSGNGGTIDALTKKVELLPGQNLSYHQHRKRKEAWMILSGTGEAILDDRLFPVEPGDVISIPCDAKHGIKADGFLVLIEVQIGSELADDDTIRFALTWEEALRVSRNAP